MKRPSFQFYPGDWLQDVALRMVSVPARGLWIEMICLMHQGSDYGYLKVNHKVILKDTLARMVGAEVSEVKDWLKELKEAGVFSINNDGCIYSRRMIKDEELRQLRASGGILSQNNPNVPRKKDTLKPESRIPLHPSPSSSSSSSSSKLKESTKEKATRLSEKFVLPTEWQNWYFRERPDSSRNELASIVSTFKDYWIAKPKDNKKLNWFSTFRNWVRRESTFSPPKRKEKFDAIAYANRNNNQDDIGNVREKDVTSEVVRVEE